MCMAVCAADTAQLKWFQFFQPVPEWIPGYLLVLTSNGEGRGIDSRGCYQPRTSTDPPLACNSQASSPSLTVHIGTCQNCHPMGDISSLLVHLSRHCRSILMGAKKGAEFGQASLSITCFSTMLCGPSSWLFATSDVHRVTAHAAQRREIRRMSKLSLSKLSCCRDEVQSWYDVGNPDHIGCFRDQVTVRYVASSKPSFQSLLVQSPVENRW